MNMKKRGQVTVYIVLGIVIVAIVALGLMFRERLIPGEITVETVQLEMGPIREHFEGCITQATEGPIREIALKGGQLTPSSYRMYNGTTISYLCYNMQDSPLCYNKMLTIASMEEELADVIDFNLMRCLDVGQFGSFFSGVDVSGRGEPTSTVTINKENVKIDVSYLIEISQGDISITEDTFTGVIDLPLGDLYDVSQDIISIETEFGEFDQLMYMLSKTGKYMIYKHRPYPDKLYQIKRAQSTDGLMFQFFVEGEPS